MAIHTYECIKCGKRKDIITRAVSENGEWLVVPVNPSVATCCGDVMSRSQKISAVPVHYKGSGFYSTDYAPKKGASSEGEGVDDAKKTDE